MRPIHDIQVLRPAQPIDAALMLAEDESRLIAGGTDLLPNLRRGIATPAVLVDLGGVVGLRDIARHHDQWHIGAGVTLATLTRHDGLSQRCRPSRRPPAPWPARRTAAPPRWGATSARTRVASSTTRAPGGGRPTTTA
jgi:hypothetical protein